MRKKKSEVRIQNPGEMKQRGYSAVVVVIILIFSFCASLSFAEEKWPGVDESVVNKIAKEHGREAWEPLINTDQGDLLLFVFLVAGTIGGFAAGYYWRVLMENRSGANRNRRA
ncbi:MAG TPA: hypothetical protein VK448_07440 [Dissulfurispiraceae bacterium]|nr:hypothetical protein [Dissulfurispiraceae bacterium]